MKEKDIKIGMKLKLVTQQIGDHKDYHNYEWKVGDIIEVLNKNGGCSCAIYNQNSNQNFYKIPLDEEDKYSRFFEPVAQTLKQFLENGR